MIIGSADDVTHAVLSEVERADDARLRFVLAAAVRHLHAFVREVRLSDAEFQQACAFIGRLGQANTAAHNEVVLMAGALGLSSLVCLLNNGAPGGPPTTANLLGPFWRDGSPRTEDGASIVRSPTPGEPVFVTAWIADAQGRAVEGAEVDVWQAAADGYYENQDPAQAEMNLRGRFVSDVNGRIRFRSVKPAGYPIPAEGPVGELLRVLGRHNLRPAHIHFLISKPGYKTQFAQVYSSDDPNLETDVAFGVTRALVADYVRHEAEPAPAPELQGPWYTLEQRFVIEPGVSRKPRAPISGKAAGPRPERVVLERKAASPRAA